MIKRKNHLVNLHRYQCTKLRQDAADKKHSIQKVEERIKKLRDKFYTDCKKIDTQLREFDSILGKCSLVQNTVHSTAPCSLHLLLIY